MGLAHENHVVRDTGLVRIDDFRCQEHNGCFGGEECSSTATLTFVRDGAYERESARGRALIDANQVDFYNPAEPYRVRHPVGGGDRCTTISLRDGVLDEPFPWLSAPCDGRTFLMQRMLLLHARDADTLAVDETALRLVDATLAAGRAAGTRDEDQHAAHRDLAEHAKQVLARRFRERLLLEDVAAETECSPFHLARTFSRTVGTTLHRYLTRLRLHAALEPIVSGQDLAAVALDHGFANQSHLTTAFGREFGTTPARARGRAARSA
jgi:AraC-like DNA-binding protein